MSSHTSFRFLDVKGRPDGNVGSSPLPKEAEQNSFANRLHDAQERGGDVSPDGDTDRDIDRRVDGDSTTNEQEETQPQESVERAPKEVTSEEADGSVEFDEGEAAEVLGVTQLPSDESTTPSLGLVGKEFISASATTEPGNAPTEFQVAHMGDLPLTTNLSTALAEAPADMQGGGSAETVIAALGALHNKAGSVRPVGNGLTKDGGSRVELAEALGLSDLPSGIETAESSAASEGQSGAWSGDGAQELAALMAEFDAQPVKEAGPAEFKLTAALDALTPLQASEGGSKVDAVNVAQLQIAQPEAVRSEAVLAQIKTSLQPGLQKANILLNPEELGRVSIEMTIEKGEVRAEMRVESKEALQILQKHLPELRAMFDQAELELTELDLQLQDFDSQSETNEQQSEEFGLPSSAAKARAAQDKHEQSQAPPAEWNRLSLNSPGLNLLA